MYAQVLVEIKAKALDKTFTYIVPDNMKVLPGMRVLVPFGKRRLEGFVLEVLSDGNYDYEVKPVIKVIDEKPVINEEMLELGKYISKKTLSPLISAYQTMLPRALKAKNNVKINKKMITYVSVVSDEGINSLKQKEVYDFIKKKNRVLKSEVSKISASALKTLIMKGCVKETKEEVYRLNDDEEICKVDYELTLQQKNVLNKISLDGFKPYLIHGVTGSGKTLVYIKLIEKVLSLGKEAILLVPEISLTPQVAMIFKRHFGRGVAILHSGLSDGEKYDEWRKIERGEVSIVIGARSAVFAPFTNLGIIIVDEEHSDTYKQENMPRYDALDIVIKRAKTYNCPAVFGSATPSIISYTRAKLGTYKLLEMKDRVNHNLPSVSLIDMKEEFKKGNRVFSEELVLKINDRFSKNEQVMILLNRRGYSTVITCRQCGYTHKCPNCDIPYTYHKSSNSMRCHYCDKVVPKLLECPECHSKSINSLGMGTEKLEVLLNEKFAGAKVIRMDVDTTKRKGAHGRIIKDFEDGKYNILIGTQMISKGLDFPNVTLVAVINGDASLNIPDFRSAERTYQLLSQVSGRAGRSEKKGEVIIQGFNIDHYSIIAACKHDYLMFYNEEIKIRKALKYPPFYNLAYVKLSGKDYDMVFDEARKIAYYLNDNLENNIILGPSVSNIPKINNVYYVGIIVKYKNTKEVIKPLYFISDKYKYNSKINVDIDLKPMKI